MRLFVIACILVGALSPAAPVAARVQSSPSQVPADAKAYRGRFYKFYPDPLTWSEAKVRAESLGGHLVTILDAGENEFLRQVIPSNTMAVWIGLFLENGQWRWLTGEPLDYANWAPGEPNNLPTESVGEITIITDYRWNNTPQGLRRGFVVEWKTQRAPVPQAAAQQDSEAAMKKLYPFAQAKSREDRIRLARMLLDSVLKGGAQGTDAFVFLRTAADLAAQAGDAATFAEAFGVLSDLFEIRSSREMPDLLSKVRVQGAEAEPWYRVCIREADGCVTADDYAGAVEMAGQAVTFARAARDPSLLAAAQEKVRELRDLRRAADALKKDFETLAAKPDDPVANAAVGKFLCLVKGEWERGLPMLAKSEDPALRSLGRQELLPPTDGPSRARLGDEWLAWANKNSEPHKTGAVQRAVHWLRQAVPDLLGADRQAVEKKIASLVPTLNLGPGGAVDLVFVRPGSFIMGSDTPRKHNFQVEERPPHKVTLTQGFHLGKYEITRRQFAAFVHATGYRTDAEREGKAWANCSEEVAGLSWKNPGFKQEDDHPVVCVSWNDARAFCEWATRKARRKVRLPTEAEWEYACRAGTITPWYFGSTDKEVDQYGWRTVETHPVGRKKPNAWGLHDMFGSVWEWCLDRAAPYPAREVFDPPPATEGRAAILRGGGTLDYRHGPCDGRSSWRLSWDRPAPQVIFGFRVLVE